MHRAAAWQHINLNIKIVHNFIEHFLCNPSDFFSDDVLSCLWIVFANSVFQLPAQKIVRWVEILEIGWTGVIGLTRNESVSWEVMPEIFKCSIREMRWRLKCFHQKNSINFQYLWRKNLEGFLIFVKVIAKEKLRHFCGPPCIWCVCVCVCMCIYVCVYVWIVWMDLWCSCRTA